MSQARTRLGMVGTVIATVLVLLVALSPTLLLGESLSANGLILTGGGVVGVGLLVRWRGPAGARTLGTILAAIGAVIVALGLGLLVLLLAGWGRGY